MYGFAPFMVATSMFGGSILLYGGFYTVGEHGREVYFLIWVAAY
jgi:hypothetical protein